MSKEQTESLGFILWKHRTAAKISQLDLAKAVGCDVSYISKMENGKKIPSREVLLLMARALGLSLIETDDLFLAAGKIPDDARDDPLWTTLFKRPDPQDARRHRFGGFGYIVVCHSHSCCFVIRKGSGSSHSQNRSHHLILSFIPPLGK